MRLRLVGLDGADQVAVAADDGWVPLGRLLPDSSWGADLLAVLGDRSAQEDIGAALLSADVAALTDGIDTTPRLPFQPRSFRDASLYEEHMIEAGRGIVKMDLPAVHRMATLYERVRGKTFPKLKPGPIWYDKPIYYMGNHLAFVADGEPVPWPSYSSKLDYELELGLVLCRPLRDADPDEAEAAIGGFVLVNDVSARDVQWTEMSQGKFGPVKSKHFCNVMGSEVVTADEVLAGFASGLAATVRVNGEVWGRGTTAGAQHTLGALVAYASQGEPLFPGELIATGTIPGCCGLEVDRWVQPGDEVTLELEKVGTLTNVYGG